MTEQAALSGDPLYEYTLQITEIVEFGVPADAIFSGQTPPPAEGARIDVHFEGPVTGARLNGTAKGVDYLHIRADGRAALDIHVEITTEDGKKIALSADGVGTPQEGSPVALLRENVMLTSNHPEYAWVNTLQVWGAGTVDFAKGEIAVKGYAV